MRRYALYCRGAVGVWMRPVGVVMLLIGALALGFTPSRYLFSEQMMLMDGRKDARLFWD